MTDINEKRSNFKTSILKDRKLGKIELWSYTHAQLNELAHDFNISIRKNDNKDQKILTILNFFFLAEELAQLGK